MPIGSGLAGFIGVGAEGSYGTYGAATRYPEVHSAKIARKPHYIQGTGLAAGRFVDPVARHVNTYFDGQGPIEMEFLTTNMGLLLNSIFGATAVPVQIGATAAYTLTCPFGSTDGLSLSIQEVVPDTAGNLHPYTALGCKFVDVEFTAERNGILMVTLTVDAQDVVETEAVDVFTGSPGQYSFHGGEATLKVGAIGGEVAVDGVKKWKLKISRKLATSRIYLGDTVKDEPITDGVVEITGSFDVDLVNPTVKAAFADVFNAGTWFSAIMDFVGPQIGASGHANEIKFATPSILLTGETPDLSGPQVVTGTFPFKVDLDVAGDNPLTGTWISGDTAL